MSSPLKIGHRYGEAVNVGGIAKRRRVMIFPDDMPKTQTGCGLGMTRP
jgi:hypothetical protein